MKDVVYNTINESDELYCISGFRIRKYNLIKIQNDIVQVCEPQRSRRIQYFKQSEIILSRPLESIFNVNEVVAFSIGYRFQIGHILKRTRLNEYQIRCKKDIFLRSHSDIVKLTPKEITNHILFNNA